MIREDKRKSVHNVSIVAVVVVDHDTGIEFLCLVGTLFRISMAPNKKL